MSITPEYQAALDALARAADAMTRACNEYNHAITSAEQPPSSALATLKKSCEEAKDAHDEALADAWELIEEQPSPDGDS